MSSVVATTSCFRNWVLPWSQSSDGIGFARFVQVAVGKGWAVLRGLPVQRWSRVQNILTLHGIGLHLGHARQQNKKGHLIGAWAHKSGPSLHKGVELKRTGFEV